MVSSKSMRRLQTFPILLSVLFFPVVAIASPDIQKGMLVTTDWLAENLENPEVVLIHVSRNPSQYYTGHIPGARLLQWEDFVTKRLGIANELPTPDDLTQLVRELGIDGTQKIVLYDDEAGVAAARAFLTFDSKGLGKRTAILDGHLKKWMAEGRPVSKETPPRSPSQYTPPGNLNAIVRLATIREIVSGNRDEQGPRDVLVDARPPAQFSGAEAGSGVGRPGHIPGAVNIPWASHIVDIENPVLRRPEEILELYSESGIGPDDRVVSYCRTGRTSSIAYFALRYLGFDVLFYDGSFTEWSAKPDTPVERDEELP